MDKNYTIKIYPKSDKGISVIALADFLKGYQRTYTKAFSLIEERGDKAKREYTTKDKTIIVNRVDDGCIEILLLGVPIVWGLLQGAIELGAAYREAEETLGRKPKTTIIGKYIEIEESKEKFKADVFEGAKKVYTNIVETITPIANEINKITFGAKGVKPLDIDRERAALFTPIGSKFGRKSDILGRVRALDLDRKTGKIERNDGKRVNCVFQNPQADFFVDKFNNNMQFRIEPEEEYVFGVKRITKKPKKYRVLNAFEIEFPIDYPDEGDS